MNISKRTLAVIRQAVLYQLWNGSGDLNSYIADAIQRICSRKDFEFHSLKEIQDALQQIGKPNKRKRK